MSAAESGSLPQNLAVSKITLLDKTRKQPISTLENVAASEDGSTDDDELGLAPLRKKITTGSLSQSIRRKATRQKFRKFDRSRYVLDDDQEPINEDPSSSDPAARPTFDTKASYVARGKKRAKNIIRRKRKLGGGKDKHDAVLDVLWENQRGFFWFGIPRYSSSSLLPSDPKPWQNAQFRTSPVDIRNAQVPDPSWEWSWKSWYVDMSRDVDEEGWEYSFAFKVNFNWHGNHPWFHSFVRRRRWLRLRTRKPVHKASTVQNPHDLASEYFTIHPRQEATYSDDDNDARTSTYASQSQFQNGDETDKDNDEITTLGQLMPILRKAAVDREKLLAVRKFVVDGGDELYYLSEGMSDIMKQFVYPASRVQLLDDLKLAATQGAAQSSSQQEHLRQESLANDADTQKRQPERDNATVNLQRAIQAAEDQIRDLKFWSDLKSTQVASPHDAAFIEASAAGTEAFANKQPAYVPGNKLHEHPEHENITSVDGGCDKQEDKATASEIKTEENQKQDKTRAEEEFVAPPLERFTTAAESVAEIRVKNKMPSRSTTTLLNPDDVVEEEEFYTPMPIDET